MAADETTTHHTACPLDCPDHCSLTVTTQAGRVVTVDGDRRNPITDAFICAKVRRIADHLYGDDRLRQPMVRTGAKGRGAFAPVSWDEALDRITDALRRARDEHGGESILPFSYGGSNGPLTEGIVDRRLFFRLGASNLARTVCATPSGAAQAGLYGRMPGVAFTDYVHSRLVVLWGMNPSASGIHMVPILRAARAAGAKLVVVDPRRVPLARQADLHLALKPGTDVVLALAVVRWLFEQGRADVDFLAAHARGVDELRARAEPWTVARAAHVTGLAAADIETFARLWADTSPAAIRCGWGVERNRNGGSAVAAVLTLPAVAGKFGVRGGGFTMSNSALMRLPEARFIGAEPPPTRTINMNRLGRTLEAGDPAVRVLFVYDCNPLATMPEQNRVRRGLEREDLLTIVFDQVMTDTARYADILLPATTFLEHAELRSGYGAPVIGSGDPVIAPVGESRSNNAVFTELIDRLGLARPDDITDDAELRRALLIGADPKWATSVARDGCFALEPGPVSFVDVFPQTPDRRIDLCPAALDAEAGSEGLYAYRPDPGSNAHPLALISPATRHTISSTFGQLIRAPLTVSMHPDDAWARALTDGATVRVFNDRGEVHARLRITADLRPGVVEIPKGLWCRSSPNGNTSNALAPDTSADLGGGATFNDARVEVAL